MSRLAALLSLLQHPLTDGHRLRALARATRWMARKWIAPGVVAVDLVDGVKLLVDSRAPGSGLYACWGLAEYEFMGFALHFLRADDLFFDVGANYGAYSLLASGAVGCRSVAFEPVPELAALVERNLDLNRVRARVTLVREALGARPGEAEITVDQHGMNHLALDGEAARRARVGVTTVDYAARDEVPRLIKIDVEGYEAAVLEGAARCLSSERLEALIVELNGLGARYGFDEGELHRRLLGRGFGSFVYDPRARELRDLDGGRSPLGNSLYLRTSALARARERVKSAAAARVFGVAL